MLSFSKSRRNCAFFDQMNVKEHAKYVARWRWLSQSQWNRATVSVFEKSNDSCQGSWLKDGEEGSKTRGGFEGYSQDRAVKKRDEVDACRFSLSFFLSLSLSLSLVHFPISLFSRWCKSMSEINATRVFATPPLRKKQEQVQEHVSWRESCQT